MANASEQRMMRITRRRMAAPLGSMVFRFVFFFSSRRRHTRCSRDWSSDVCSSDLFEALPFEVVSGSEARKDPLMPEADVSESFIKIHLARAVPPEGRGRLLIVKTYKDPQSYYREGGGIVFNRGLGIKRNRVILPAGYELVSRSEER